MFRFIKTQIKVIREYDPAARSNVEILLCYPGMHSLLMHRPAHWLWQRGFRVLARCLSHLNRFLTGIEIHPGAVIDDTCFIDHGMGIVIGETAVVGKNVRIFHGVTLGGTGKDKGKRHPTVGDGVLIGARATILGPIYIGESARIGAGAVVLDQVQPGQTMVGVPAVPVAGGRRVPRCDLSTELRIWRRSFMKVFTEMVKTIGNTPMLEIPATPERGRIVLKLEGFNPGGSVKDRIAESMLRDALKRGLVNADTILIEATSGNTGIGMAMAAASLKVPLLLVMPETMSIERRKLLLAYGAQLVLTPGPKGMKGAIEKVNELKAADYRYLHLDQFGNPANPQIHYETTGPEILEALEGRIDALVAGVGTGGTITGAGRFLKGRVKGIQLVAVEPALSPVLSGGNPGPHPIMGIGAGFVPAVLDTKLLDRIITVEAEDARGTARMLAGDFGLLTGISGGAAVWAALEVAKELGPDSTVVTVAPDTGERYLSTDLFPAQEA